MGLDLHGPSNGDPSGPDGWYLFGYVTGWLLVISAIIVCLMGAVKLGLVLFF